MVSLHKGVFNQNVAIHNVVHIGVIAVVDADNRLMEVVQHGMFSNNTALISGSSVSPLSVS